MFSFGLPPHLAAQTSDVEKWQDICAAFSSWLEPVVGPVDVTLAESYEAMARNLRSGALHAAWVPPLVGAAAERDGAQVLARFVRQGGARVRAAIFVHRDHQEHAIDDAYWQNAVPAWVDRHSLTGYLLPLKWLQKVKGVDNVALGEKQAEGHFCHTLGAALERVAAQYADFTAVYYAGPKSVLLSDFPGVADDLHLMEVTLSAPADGVALSEGSDAQPDALMERLMTLSDPSTPTPFSEIFGADGMAKATPAEHDELLALLR
ncbi:MAG: phosphate/phosphite/phosphonate ABC transporter substrate-binding protein [Deltaproteobacteria bacterium]|nr:phosphate/phosphite/phosphonate ABC transporter substrate-binding protein [Deltaproteobacteria bacterium]